MDRLLPEIKRFDDYRRVYRDETVWLPAMRAICDRHGFDAGALAFAPPGTHVVFGVGTDLYLKLFSPLWGADFTSEGVVLRALAGLPDLPVPRLVAEGRVEEWPYLVLTAVPGVPLNQVWERMEARERTQVVRDCGRFLAALHAAPTEGLDAIAVEWAPFCQERIEARIRQVQASGLGPRWLDSVRAFLHDLPPLYEPGFCPVLLCADLTDEHVMVSERGGRWTFTGVIDFGDAMLGHPLYEFAAPGCSITRGAPDLQRALLRAYGFGEGELGEALAVRLMAYTLLHRYIRLPDLLALHAPNVPADLDALRRSLWSFGSAE